VSAVSPAAPLAAAEAASALYERHRVRVLRFCQSRLGSREDAEDATQTTFLNAVGALRRGTVPHAEAAWLLRIAENVCHHRHRTAARRNESACDPTVLEDVVEAAPGPPDELIHLAAGLESLPERQRVALLLREWQGLSYNEIGAELGLSHSAVETLLFRARRGLAQALEQADGRKQRRGLDLVALLGWVKTAVGGGAALKVAAAVVVAGVAIVPVRDAPTPSAHPSAKGQSVVYTRGAAPAATSPSSPAVGRKTVAAKPKPATRRTRPTPAGVRGGHPAVVEPEPTVAPTPVPKETRPAPSNPAPPVPESKTKPDAPSGSEPALPVEPPVQLPLPTPLPDVTDAVPPLPLPVPELPELPQLPDLPAPQLPLSGLP
jgi:RNA polymerase sigma factor (sigma-70 family)